MADWLKTRRQIRAVIGWVLLALFILMVAVWSVFGLAPELIEHAPEPLHSFANVEEFWPILLAAIAGAGAAWGLAPGFRGNGGEGGVLSPVALAILGPAALIMMFSAYWPCGGHEAQFWAALRHALEAFEGYVAEPFGEVDGCPAEFPQGLMAGVLFGKATLVLALLIGLGYIFRQSIDSARVRFARQIVVISGITGETADAVRRVGDAANLPAGRRVVLLDAGPELDRAREIARDLARTVKVTVLPVDVSDPDAVATFVRGRRRRGIQGLYLLSADGSGNLRAMDRFLAALDESDASESRSEVPPRVVVRVDNPWHAEDWRRKQMIGRSGWLFDAVSLRELAARHVVSRMMAQQPRVDRVVVSGGSAFELAVLSELSFEQRLEAHLERTSQRAQAEWDSSAGAYRPYSSRAPKAVLVGVDGANVAAHFSEQLERFGVEDAAGFFDVKPDEDRAQAMERLLAAGHTPALITKEDEETDSTFLAVRHPRWTIFDWSTDARGLTDEPLLGGLSMVGPTITPVPGFGFDIWDRLGAIQNLTYLLNFRGGVPDSAGEPVDAWDELDAFTRESNIRSFATFSRGVGELGLPRRMATDLGSQGTETARPLDDPAEIDELARREHDSWVAHHREYGFRFGPERSGLRHPDMVEWAELDAVAQRKDSENVRATNELLGSLGFVLTTSS